MKTLTEISRLKKSLSTATKISQIKMVRDRAEAARVYARAAKLGLDVENRAAELRLRAERKAGTMLSKMKLSKGGRPSENSRPGGQRLADLGWSKSQSSRWQHLASVPAKTFQRYLREAKADGSQVTANGLLRQKRAR